MAARATKWFAVFLIIIGLGFGAKAVLSRGSAAPGKEQPRSEGAVLVEVVAPRAGGISRVVSQPGSLEPQEYADLYCKVSGFLVEQDVTRNGKKHRVDIGTLVQAGEVVARLAVPESEKQVKQDEAEVVRAEARLEQAKATVATAQADQRAALATIAFSQAEVKSKTSYRLYREKQRDRIRVLASKEAIDRKLEEEQEDQYQSAVSAESAALESVNAAKQKEAAAAAKVKQALADVTYGEAEVAVAKAKLDRSRVLLDYTVIRSPYSGVITRRNFHVGDFIKSADSGGERLPLQQVERVDSMRVVVQVPERDVPYVDVGDSAEVKVDALNGTYKAAVSRLAASEDPHTRMMRIELDLPNPGGKLRRGMFGRVSLTLDAGAPAAVRIPSAALVGKAEDGKAAVRVIRDDVAQTVPVRYGADSGTDVEILSGLTLADRVIVRANGPVENGTLVTTSRP